MQQRQPYSNINNLDELIMNQGYLSDRTKSPSKKSQTISMGNYIQPNKLNSARDMSPNKINVKSKPLLFQHQQQQHQQSMNMIGYPQQQYQSNNQFVQNQQQQSNLLNQNNRFAHNNNTINLNMNLNTNTNTNKNFKSPRSPTNFINHSTTKCLNHPNKQSQYMVNIEGEEFYYCFPCAGKLAAQKFEVKELPTSRINNGNNMMSNQYHIKQSKTTNIKNNKQPFAHNNNNINQNKPSTFPYPSQPRQVPSIPQYFGNPIYESIIQFLKQIFQIQQYHYDTLKQFTMIDEHYEEQIEMVDRYYQQLVQIIQQMRNDHIEDLQEEKNKNSQIADIYIHEINDNLETIDSIISDLGENFQTVITKVTEEDLKFFDEALEKNRSNIRFFVDQIQQQRDVLKGVTKYQEEKFADMIKEFEKMLMDLWMIQDREKKEMSGKDNNNFNVDQSQKQKDQNNNNMNRLKNLTQPVNNHNMSNLNILQPSNHNIKQPNNNLGRDFEGKTAFRKIFQDDDENVINFNVNMNEDENDEMLNQKVSPKFKVI